MTPKKIVLYRSSICTRCKRAAAILKRLLSDKGLQYETVVEEKFADEDSPVIEELRQLTLETVPVIKIGDRFLFQNDALNIQRVKKFLDDSGI